ncbi:MAG: hypothetical protein WC096_05685, partial [Sphaerochaetaceae bacterium]
CRVGHALRNSYKMDVTTEEAMTNMEEEAEEMFEEKEVDMKAYAKLLSTRTVFDQLKLGLVGPQPLALEAQDHASQATGA